jgi:hypothetical protein
MREKKRYLVVAFHTTTQAMAFEKAAKSQGFTGRLIPLPGVISAGCGLAWRDEPSTRTTMVSMMQEHALTMENMYELIL